jgi:pimeloyl-ACP methyl ester carboxylesterase
MLGGGITGASAFASHARVLARDFRVVRLQTLNVDRALRRQPLPRVYSIRLESQAMASALDELGLRGRVYIAGHSLGALVALDFALDHRTRVAALVLSEPPAFWVVPPEEAGVSTEIQEKRELTRHFGPTAEPTDDQLVAFLRSLGVPDPRPPRADEPGWTTWLARKASLRGLRAIQEHRDDVRRLKTFDRPVLLVTGSNTTAFHRRVNDILAAHLPLIQRAELPGGHAAAIEEYAAFSAILRDFLASH